MGVWKRPIGYKTYYSIMHKRALVNLEEALEKRKELANIINIEHEDIKSNLDIYKDKFNIDLMNYPEFVENKYITGNFNKIAKGLYLNRNNNYELTGELFNLVKYVDHQKNYYKLEKEIEKLNKLVKLKMKDYKEILEVFYYKVQELMIKKGIAYAFEGMLGCIVINRCHLLKHRPMLDFQATKQREKELLAAGKKIYNKEEADWCARNGIEYKAEDKRVFRKDEYCYEIPLIHCRITNGHSMVFKSIDFMHKECRHKTKAQLLKECHYNVDELCKLKCDIRLKLLLCIEADKTLYIKYIRNEKQEPFRFRTNNRED